MLKEIPYNVWLLLATCLFLGNLIYAIKDIRKRFLYLFFQITTFVFLLARPIIEFLRKETMEGFAEQMIEGRKVVLIFLVVIECSILVGAVLCEKYGKKAMNHLKFKHTSEEFRGNLQVVALLVCIVTLGLYTVQQLEPLLAIGMHNYVAYYTSFQSKLPGIVHTIASFMKYSLCIYLATLPGKRNAFIMLSVYVLSTIPSLLIGMRNPFVLSLLFALTYYMLRDYLEGKSVWIGKTEKILMCIAIPALMIAMIFYSYVRMGANAGDGNIVSLLVDFFYNQGNTFDVVAVGKVYETELREMCPNSYTFGGFVDYIYRGTVGQALFGTTPLTAGNSEFNALHGNSLAHALSYLANKESYLAGVGLGTSFVLDTYIDYGYAGLILFSVLLGVLFVVMIYGFGKKVLLSTIILYSLTNLFFIPRAEAMGWLTFIVTIQFWACVAGCYFVSYICTRFKILEKVLKRQK